MLWYESLEGSSQENKKKIVITRKLSRKYEIKSRKYEIKSRNYEIKSRNYEIKSRNYEIKSRNYEKIMSY